jgi:ABC-type branched-subunit amino acid transport system ATPase component/ABC-type branched-subunit amino acid transport system permease subunit
VIKLLIYILLSLPLVGAYAMLTVGIVVIFRASRVLNLAHGAMAMLPAYLVYDLSRHGWPMVVAVPVAVASGGALGLITERVFVRTLRRQGPTAQTVGTIAMFGLIVSLVAKHYGTTPFAGPSVFPSGGFRLRGTILFYGDLGLFFTAMVAAGALFAVFKFTTLGLTLRGAADNRVAAMLVGINPNRSAQVAWLIGGSLAGLAGVLLGGVTTLSPYSLSLQMLPAFVAALIGGLASLPGALAGAALVGLITGLVPAMAIIHSLAGVAGQIGMPQLVLTITALAVMYLRGGRYSSSDIRAEQATGTGEVTAGRRWFEPRPPTGMRRALGLRIRTWRYALLLGLVVWPFLHPPFSLLGDSVQACLYFIASASIVLLTGWVGQISLSQAAFIGIGGFGSAIFIRDAGMPFPFNLILAAGLAAAVAVILGFVALRVRGLYLAVATLIFGFMADSYLFSAPWFAGSGGNSSADVKTIGKEGLAPFIDFSNPRTLYLVCFGMCALVVFALLNLRDSKSGRAFFAIRGSEMAAASLGIDVRRYKLVAFALAGAICGVAGNLTFLGSGTVVSSQFSLSVSLLVLSIAVVGGLQSLGGCVAASIVFAGLNELFFRVAALTGYLDVVSALLLAVVLLVYPGGLAAIPAAITRRLKPVLADSAVAQRAMQIGTTGGERVQAGGERVRAAVSRVTERSTAGLPRALRAERRKQVRVGMLQSAPTPIRSVDVVRTITPAAEDTPGRRLERMDFGDAMPIEASNVRVVFDGLVAVDDASLTVGPGEIVGLIGPNGAGKTTLFNAISGLVVPTTGRVSILGHDVTDESVHERAQLGLGRTFQAIQLFPQLSVYENLLVATHCNNPTGMFSHITLTKRAVRHEAAAEETVRNAVRFMRLESVADRTVAGLPFGVLRRVEIARTLVAGSPVVMLDEPASGLDNAETDLLSELLVDLRERLGLSLLLIEHDVRMVMSIVDRMYVLVHGKIVAQGTPAEVRDDPVVVKAYLGESAKPAVPAARKAAARTSKPKTKVSA